jgi:hypothetical protein
MSEKIRLNEEQMATLSEALRIAAVATYAAADLAEGVLDMVNAGALRDQAEDFELLLGYADQVERITVRLYSDVVALPTRSVI